MYFSNPEKSWNFKILTLHFKRVYYNLLTSSIVLLIHGYIIIILLIQDFLDSVRIRDITLDNHEVFLKKIQYKIRKFLIISNFFGCITKSQK